MVRLKAGQRAVKQASHAAVASMGSFGSDVVDATRMFARDAPAVARRVQQDVSNAALDVHDFVQHAGVMAGKGLCQATHQVGFICSFPMQCMLQNCITTISKHCDGANAANVLHILRDVSGFVFLWLKGHA